MKVNVIGAGPSGLYLGIMMKLADPGHEIHVYERNRPDDTFGFGVVFSDDTLSHFLGLTRTATKPSPMNSPIGTRSRCATKTGASARPDTGSAASRACGC